MRTPLSGSMNGGEDARGLEKVHLFGWRSGSHSLSIAVIPAKTNDVYITVNEWLDHTSLLAVFRLAVYVQYTLSMKLIEQYKKEIRSQWCYSIHTISLQLLITLHE